MSIHIRSITIGTAITISYLEGNDERVLKTPDEPLESLYNALTALVGDIAYICGLESTVWAEARLISVVLKTPELGATSSAKFTLAGRPMPDMPEVKIPTNFIQATVLGPSFTERLATVLEEAERFVNGDRAKAQLELLPKNTRAKEAA